MPLPLAFAGAAVFGALFLAGRMGEEEGESYGGSSSGRPEVDALEKAAAYLGKFGRQVVPWPDGSIVQTEGYDRGRIRFTGPPISDREESYLSYLRESRGLSEQIVRLSPGLGGDPDTIELVFTK